MLRLPFIVLFSLLLIPGKGQYNWKLEKEKNGISVYLSSVAESSFKAVKVECLLTGSYAKLISILTNMTHFSDWVYRNKSSRLLKQNTALDYVYYTETSMPWPMSNRDAVIHLKIKTDSLPKFLIISGTGTPGFSPDVSGKVRVPHYKANWMVTMPTDKTIRISYLMEVDPGGSIPAWIANSFAEKGPFETFSNLAENLKK